ncbi:MAG: hypothetical protein V7605_401 [Acidimicrobiaceae bacterium]|jgi:hypothetical protein
MADPRIGLSASGRPGPGDVARHYFWRVAKRLVLAGDMARHDALAMQALQPLSTAFVPWSTLAMRPAGLMTVLNEVFVNRRRHVVECGGGVSTLYLARLLDQVGGHLWTIEDDPSWARLLGERLAHEGLSSAATVIHAPLEPTPLSWNGASWYGRSALDAGLGRQRIDLLVVDGPKAYSRELRYSRYPALPYFWGALAPDFAVVLDDINRLGEQRVVARWEADYPVDFDRRLVDGSIALGLPRPAHLGGAGTGCPDGRGRAGRR